MRVLVTGGAGFIGSHLCEELLGRGCAVTILDNLNDYYPPEWKRDNLAAVRRTGEIAFYEDDIRDDDAVDQVFAATEPDAVIHLAAVVGVRPSVDAPLLYESVNTRGTTVLLEACRRHKVSRFLFTSSSAVYGAPGREPFSVESTPTRPISPYAATKLAGEHLCHVYSHLYGMKITCLRLFTVYGPRQRPDLAISKFARLIEAGELIPVFGDGKAARDYTFVGDIVQGFVAALSYDCSWDVLNLGNARPVTLGDLIATLERAIGKRALIQRLPMQPGDAPYTCADIAKTRERLGYEPMTALDDGITRFLRWDRRTRRRASVISMSENE